MKARDQKAQALPPGSRGRGKDHRLSPLVRPTDVDLYVEVDPQRSDAFRGTVRHHLEITRATPVLELHADGIRVTRPRLVTTDGARLRGKLQPCPERETIEIRFDRRLPRGDAVLELDFRGTLRSDLRGLYRAASGKRRYAVSQLEATDARRFFPCFDEPAMKARWQVTVCTGRRNTVITNARLAKEERAPGGRKTLSFERTPRLSSYLLALAVGEFSTSRAVRCGNTEIRIRHVPGKEGLTAFGLECAKETLARLERYFNLPYPYSKLDLVAVPDFEAGAMENAGAVFFRETLLLADPKTLSFFEKKRVAEVICHELAHMWYGDLVTMHWWDDLWLNEAFATWMAFHIVNEWKPEWRMWSDFQHMKGLAFALDALRQTHPVYTRVRSPSDATENFDEITYEKGAAVVRMLERYLSPSVFRSGVRRYIRRHREGNASAADLWRALSEASGQDVEPVVRAWVERPGFPLLKLQRRGNRLRYRQERFVNQGKGGAAKGGRGAAGKVGKKGAGASRGRGAATPAWPIPWVGRIGTASGGRLKRELLTRKSGEITLGQGSVRFVYGNAGESGFFRPLHEQGELETIARFKNRLDAVERIGLLEHQWAAVRGGHASVDVYLDLALGFDDERDPDVLASLTRPLAFCAASVGRSLGAEAEAAFRARVAEAFAAPFAECGFGARTRESDAERERRAVLLALVGRIGALPEVVRQAARLCQSYLDNPASVEPNLAADVIEIGVRSGDETLYERFLEGRGRARTPQQARRMLLALGAFRKPALIRRTLALSLGREVETQDVAFLLARLLGNPAAAPLAWAFMKKRWKALCRRLPPMLVTHPIEALPALASRAARRDVAAFFRDNPVPTGRRALRQTLERFDADLAFDVREQRAFRRWLGG